MPAVGNAALSMAAGSAAHSARICSYVMSSAVTVRCPPQPENGTCTYSLCRGTPHTAQKSPVRGRMTTAPLDSMW